MNYLALQEIITELDAHQRTEQAVLDELAKARPDVARKAAQARDARRRMLSSAVFFIEQSWAAISPAIAAFSLAENAGKSPEELNTYLRGLLIREPAYAWGWTRARMNAHLMRHLNAAWPGLVANFPSEMKEYANSLKALDHYGFRVSPQHHLRAGYHTALAVACKWYGTAAEHAANHPGSQRAAGFTKELRLFASCSMTMLARTDRWLWDSAGAEPMDAQMEGNTMRVAHKPVSVLNLETQQDCGVRMGCPALRAKAEEGPTPFNGIVEWVERVYSEALLDGAPFGE